MIHDRTVVLLASRTGPAPQIEISNPTEETVSFTLGLNEQLFEDKQALLDSIVRSQARSCRRLENARDLMVPCAAFETVAARILHFPELTDQVEEQNWAVAPRWWADSPMLALNSFGFGTCGTYADVLAKLWKELGYPIRRRNLNGHTVTELQVGGRWLMFDADLRAFLADHKRVLGIDDLFANPQLAANRHVWRPLPGKRNGDFPHAGLDFYQPLLEASQGDWRAVSPVPTGAQDWRELTFTLPAGARLVFPEESGNDCVFPEFVDYREEFGDLTDPPHRYAVLQLPAGTVANMQNGLYAAQITGDYRVTAIYAHMSETTEHFDELHGFRYARRFALSFQPIEARSAVAIYYLLNAKVGTERVNRVRLHGDGVDRLAVRLLSRKDAAVPQPPVDVPYMPPQDDILTPIRVCASSSSYGNEELPANLVDGKLLTGWTSDVMAADQPQEILLDLGNPELIDGVRWTPHSQYGMLSPPVIVVATSLDGENFRDVARVTDYHPQRVEWQNAPFPCHRARYVRLTVSLVPHFVVIGSYQVALGEIEVLRSTAAQDSLAD
jgi:hypothetical protein